jgi:hypothetical protein
VTDFWTFRGQDGVGEVLRGCRKIGLDLRHQVKDQAQRDGQETQLFKHGASLKDKRDNVYSAERPFEAKSRGEDHLLHIFLHRYKVDVKPSVVYDV